MQTEKTTIKTKKQIIYEEAAKLFRDKGYKAASMRDLADRVQLKASSLYSHIGSKEEILRKICLVNANRFVDSIKEIEQQNNSATEKVKTLIRRHIEVATEDVTSITVFNDEWRHLSEPYLSDFLGLRKVYEKRFQKIIQGGIDQGEFKPVNAKIALFTILTSVRWIHYWYKVERSISREDLERDIITILTSGLRK